MGQNSDRRARILLINPNSLEATAAMMVVIIATSVAIDGFDIVGAQDGAEAVIGGGPLGEVARELQPMFTVPVIAPIPSAVRRIIRLITA
jgi:Asp/Glu/hydantoin racemase